MIKQVFRLILPTILFAALSITHLSCSGEKKESKAPVEAKIKNDRDLAFTEVVDLAKTSPKYFSMLCQSLMNTKLILAINEIPPDDNSGTRSLNIKVLPSKVPGSKGVALIFSGKKTLMNAGERLKWQKDDSGAYPIAVMKGRSLFRTLQSNGYKAVVLDLGNPIFFPFDAEDIGAMAEGQVPPFRAR